ncbi:MAG TPA: thiosulfate oxidation carrier protein SoxY [Burkholderiales bacterium]|nr:thiosulfate oxidation carrier protein SoxY [Burkholderiales bacterium]
MNQVRRSFLRLAAGSGTLAMAAAAGLLHTGQAWAWNKAGFESKALADVLKSLGASGAAESGDIVITAPDIAENGAVVPVAVTSRIPGTQQISIVAEKNPFPLAATFAVAGGGEGYVSTRLKMGQTSDVWAVVKAGDKYFVAKKEVKVTVGGCG